MKTLPVTCFRRKIRHALPLLLAAAALLASAGCANPWHTASRNIDNSKRLRVGMTKSEVLEVMGEPLSDEIFCKPDCWYYYIEPVWVDGLTTEEECMPLVFEDGTLVGWGRGFYVRYRLERKNAAPETAVNPALESALDLKRASAPAKKPAPAKPAEAKQNPAKQSPAKPAAKQ